MDLRIELNGRTHKVALPARITPGQAFALEVAGQTLSATLLPHAAVLVLRNGDGLERNVHLRRTVVSSFSGEMESQLRAEIRLGGRMHYAHATGQPDLPGHEGGQTRSGSREQVVRSQITGKILKILIKKGDQTTSGQALLVIEAMKMENRVFTQLAGTISSIGVKEGDAVSTGKELLRIKL